MRTSAQRGSRLSYANVTSTHIKDNSLRAADLTDDPIGVARGYVWNYRDASPLNEASPLEGSYRYNSSGGATSVTRTAVGIYQVRFEGLTLDAGTVHVTAYGSNAAACKVVSWGGEGINVRSFDAAGNPANSLFTVAYLE